jgi:two-component system LytT family response regulator
MRIRTFVVDDEPLARLNLSSLLEAEPDFELAGEFADGRSAASAICEQRPDLVFLDVQMPNASGLEVIGSLAADRSPLVVFVTAHEHYAVQAFEAQALDYLLKPFRRERFHATLDRVRSRFATPPRFATAQAQVERSPDRMIVKCGDRVVVVPFDELAYVRAAANYVQLHLADRTYDVREKISTMELRLPADRFLRVHRSYLVNLTALQELYPVGGGEYMIALRNGKQLPVGPTYPSSIRRALAGARLPRFGRVSAV